MENIVDKYLAYFWVKKVIQSCTNYRQDNNATNLIENFGAMYNDSDLTIQLYTISLLHAETYTKLINN